MSNALLSSWSVIVGTGGGLTSGGTAAGVGLSGTISGCGGCVGTTSATGSITCAIMIHNTIKCVLKENLKLFKTQIE